MNLLQEFKKFAMRGNAIDLAVGVVIGAAFTQITTSIANDVLTPALSLLIGNIDLSHLAVPVRGTTISYGAVIQAVINFLITALALFLIVKGVNRLALSRRASEEKKPAEEKEEIKVLKEIRDELKRVR
jgi:large conductance mechanosensitive channel